jgi:hypothetical protein
MLSVNHPAESGGAGLAAAYRDQPVRLSAYDKHADPSLLASVRSLTGSLHYQIQHDSR